MDERLENQEIYCHACDRYVQFPMDLSMNGNHVLNCPNCGHEHCRVVKDGKITGDRWDQRNGDTFRISARFVTATASSASTNGSYFIYGSIGTSGVSSGTAYTWTGS